MTTQVPHGPIGPVAEPQQPAPQRPAAPQYASARHPEAPQYGAVQQQQQPVPTYPTAPPWAAVPWAAAPDVAPPASPPPSYGAVAPYGSPLPEHGQLLVPFPEEMHTAGRVNAPAWWPVVLWTLLCAVPGLVSARRRAAQARRGHNSRVPYWIAFVLGLVVAASVAVAAKPAAVQAWYDFRERAYAQALQQNLVKDGRLTKTARVTAKSARCAAAGARGADDLRRYSCQLKLADGRTGVLDVTADRDGNWTAVPPKR